MLHGTWHMVFQKNIKKESRIIWWQPNSQSNSRLNIVNQCFHIINTSFIRRGLRHQDRKLETNARPTPGRGSPQNTECRQNETFDNESRKNDRIGRFCWRSTLRKYKEKRLLRSYICHPRHCIHLHQFSKLPRFQMDCRMTQNIFNARMFRYLILEYDSTF